MKKYDTIAQKIKNEVITYIQNLGIANLRSTNAYIVDTYSISPRKAQRITRMLRQEGVIVDADQKGYIVVKK